MMAEGCRENAELVLVGGERGNRKLTQGDQ
jgi:hypothetical protein